MRLNFDMKAPSQLISERGLQTGGRVQKFIDQECIRHMDQYTPRITGNLIQTATIGTVIGSGLIEQTAPQARYLYYGKLMVSSETGSAYASHGETKVLTDTNLKYTTSANPRAGKMWFERMKTDWKDKILTGAQTLAGGR